MFRSGEGPNEVNPSRRHPVRTCGAGGDAGFGTAHSDPFQPHGFDAMAGVEEVLSTLDGLVRAGKLGYVGV